MVLNQIKVRKIIQYVNIFNLIFCNMVIAAEGQSTPTLTLVWTGETSGSCQRLVESFLTELRAMAGDQLIELEAKMNQDVPFLARHRAGMRCVDKAIELDDGEVIQKIHYSPKANGFDANEWIPIQERYLRPWDLSLPPRSFAPANNLSINTSANTTSPTLEPDSVFNKWWFWTLVGTAAAGTFALTQSGKNSSTMNVQIH